MKRCIAALSAVLLLSVSCLALDDTPPSDPPFVGSLYVTGTVSGLGTVTLYLPVFQSSRSLRTATSFDRGGHRLPDNFNPRGPCGPRQFFRNEIAHIKNISILAVLADRDVVDTPKEDNAE